MGRPPCCDKVGIKKGPWTPEEDIILVSYIQEHGPGNWRSVPTNTGLMRCSKSCRLRWTNYLRPGIKRGNFTQHEEGMIIHLQSLLGNRWAAIASYLPQRTNNDIKNYWNTHLKKKKMNKYDQTAIDIGYMTNSSGHSATPRPRGCSTTYASSTKNISRLLENWITRPSPKPGDTTTTTTTTPIKMQQHNNVPVPQEELEESLLLFENSGGIGWNKDSSSLIHRSSTTPTDDYDETKPRLLPVADQSQQQPPAPALSVLEKWLLDEAATTGQQVEDLMELSDVAMF